MNRMIVFFALAVAVQFVDSAFAQWGVIASVTPFVSGSQGTYFQPGNNLQVGAAGNWGVAEISGTPTIDDSFNFIARVYFTNYDGNEVFMDESDAPVNIMPGNNQNWLLGSDPYVSGTSPYYYAAVKIYYQQHNTSGWYILDENSDASFCTD